MIEAVGGFIMQGNFVIGLVVFAILVIVNFVVITKGSGRIAEVSARFSLDAMPGKQMAIDADLSAGLIDEHEARQRRRQLEEESSFYGAMNGAAKFVRGDAIAGLLITFINLVGGLIIGVGQMGVSFAEAARTYSLLTVGDGLVSQIPALIVSTAAGLLVAEVGVGTRTDRALFGQLGAHPRALGTTSGLLAILAILPGLPVLPFLTLAGVSGALAWPSAAPMPAAELLGILAARGHPIEAVVLPRDALGRALLRAAGLVFQVDTPLDLPVGARLQLSLPAPLARSSAPPLQGGPLEAVRTLAASLREPREAEQSPDPQRLRMPEAGPTLAARLLRLAQLIAPRSDHAAARDPGEPAMVRRQAGAAGVAAALAELGRLAAEAQGGGWRVLLLPLGFAGTPLLRLYLREGASEEDGRGERHPDRSGGARRAVFDLEFSELGRCQIDVLCQARRFDLLVRTGQPLPARLRRDVRELYLAARDVAGLVGEVRFRADQWLALPEPTGAGGAGGGITV